jgi:hypothetical protein
VFLAASARLVDDLFVLPLMILSWEFGVTVGFSRSSSLHLVVAVFCFQPIKFIYGILAVPCSREGLFDSKLGLHFSGWDIGS